MKKFLTAFLFVCTCALSAAAVACKDPSNPSGLTSADSGADTSSSIVQRGSSILRLQQGEGYKYVSDEVYDGIELTEGEEFSFSIQIGALYMGTPSVFAGDELVVPDDDGTYTVTATKGETVVRVEGIRKQISNMTGSGTMDDAFVVTQAIDLDFIAEQVNKGNRDYTTAAYILANDIDCQGAELEIIGNYSTQEAVFSGSFACVTDPDTGAIERHTISNFSINSEDSNYVGLFGAAFSDASVESSALFYGILLDNFTINAGVNEISQDNKTVSCGALVGYSVGANYYLCDATNGSINVNADQNYFSFVGGLVGYQQGFYDSGRNLHFPTEISYSKVDVDVNILGGVSLYSGGIVGFMTTNYPFGSNAAVHNAYALGDVNGALRSGGIVGGMGQYTAVSNCYATGQITARSYQSYDSPLITSDTYSHAYAGGLVGFAENDSIAHDSFFNGTVSAYTVSGSAYEHVHHAIGGGDEAANVSVDSEKYIALNCRENLDLTDDEIYTKELGWGEHNWVFLPGTLPTINYESPDGTITATMVINYVAPALENTEIKMGGQSSVSHKYFDTSIQSLNSYSHIGGFMASGSLAQYYEADNGFLSYGYFFDAECTQRVPYSYFPMKNITMYIGFADPTPVVGTYYFLLEDNTVPYSIEFTPKGIALYSDGKTQLSANYSFDGNRVVLEGARLARYYQGKIEIDEEDTSTFADASFDLYRYDFYNFLGSLTDGGMDLYDGKYFTKDAPLVSKKSAMHGEYFVKNADGVTYYTFYGDRAVVETAKTGAATTYAEYDVLSVNGTEIKLSSSTGTYPALTLNKASLLSYDAYKGTWAKSATVNKLYEFDGMGKWTYSHVAYERKWNGYLFSFEENLLESAEGSYQIVNGTLHFTHDGVALVASFNQDGHLEIVGNALTQTYYASNSFVGTWMGKDYTLTFNGINKQGVGFVSMETEDGYVTDLIYETSQTNGIIALYYPANESGTTKDVLHGYVSYDVRTNTLRFVQPNEDSDSGFAAETLYLYDNYLGEWVCNLPSLQNVEFLFNGMGLYSHLGMGLGGTLTLIEDGEKTVVAYSLDSALRGTFSYKGILYEMQYDEDSQLVVISLGADTSLERKDELANVDFVDLSGVHYSFDGKSSLDCFGTLTVGKDEKYTYAPAENGFSVLNKTGAVIGSVVKNSTHYLLTLKGKATELYIANEFMGDWAISGKYALFHIGPTDLNGVIRANYKGSDVELTFIDPVTLTFFYREDKMPYTYYVFVVEDTDKKQDVLVLSEFTNLTSGEYLICSKVNDLFGTWKWQRDNGKTTLKFDGVSSSYVNGYAERTLQLSHVAVTTDYYYIFRDGGIIMWSRDMMGGRTWYFRLDLVPEDELEEAVQKGSDAYVLYDENGKAIRALRCTEVDGLYLTTAYDADGAEYVFDGSGNLLVDGTLKYTYKIRAYNNDNTATLEVTELATGITYSATLDYKDQSRYLFILGGAIPEEDDSTETETQPA